LPTAALGVIAYGEPATVALTAAPALVSVMLSTVSLLINPTTVKSVEGVVSSKTTVSP
jgi:hypothetical protein